MNSRMSFGYVLDLFCGFFDRVKFESSIYPTYTKDFVLWAEGNKEKFLDMFNHVLYRSEVERQNIADRVNRGFKIGSVSGRKESVFLGYMNTDFMQAYFNLGVYHFHGTEINGKSLLFDLSFVLPPDGDFPSFAYLFDEGQSIDQYVLPSSDLCLDILLYPRLSFTETLTEGGMEGNTPYILGSRYSSLLSSAVRDMGLQSFVLSVSSMVCGSFLASVMTISSVVLHLKNPDSPNKKSNSSRIDIRFDLDEKGFRKIKGMGISRVDFIRIVTMELELCVSLSLSYSSMSMDDIQVVTSKAAEFHGAEKGFFTFRAILS